MSAQLKNGPGSATNTVIPGPDHHRRVAMGKRTCSIQGCEKPVNGRGWCKMHLTRFYRHGDPMAVQAYPDRCSIEGCERKFYARGWCRLHYNRWLSSGDPLLAVEQYKDPDESFAARTRRDPATGCLVWVGSKNSGGYGQIYVGNDSVPVHRYAWERANGPVPEAKILAALAEVGLDRPAEHREVP